MEDRVGGGDAVRRRLERQLTDRRLESRVDAYGTLLNGARRHKPWVYSSSVGWPVGPPPMPCAYMGMYSFFARSEREFIIGTLE